MHKKLMRAMSKVTALAMVAMMFAGIAPAKAAGSITDISDTMDRQQMGVQAEHLLAFTLTDMPDEATVTFDYADFALDASAVLTVTNSGTGEITAFITAMGESSSNIVEVVCDSEGSACTGDFSVSFTGENPATADSYVVQIAGEYAGEIQIPIVDSDQVTIHASVLGEMTFDIDTAVYGRGAITSVASDEGDAVFTSVAHGLADGDRVIVTGTTNYNGTWYVVYLGEDTFELAAELPGLSTAYIADDDGIWNLDIDADDTNEGYYSVNLGELSYSAVNKSGDEEVNHIWLDLTHNATGGAIVTVNSQFGALQSESSSSDEIGTTSGSYAAGDENYGMCVAATWATEGTFDTDFEDCSGVTAMSALTAETPLTVVSSTGALFEGRAQLTVAAGASVTTPAHPDYYDVLTFIATPTF